MTPIDLARRQTEPGSRAERSTAPKADDGTAARILDVAERRFADRGYAAVSMRMITGQSGVNLAAANYHFGTKARLFEAVLARRIVPINRERVRLLNDTTGNSRDRDTRLRSIIEAYVRPLLACREIDAGCDAVVVMKMLAKVLLDLTEHAHFVAYYEDMRRAFIDAIHRCLPELSTEEVVFRYNLMVAVIAFFALGDHAHMVRLRGAEGAAAAAPVDVESAIERLCGFIGLGMLPADASVFRQTPVPAD